MGTKSKLTASEAGYLKLIYRVQEEESGEVGTTAVARAFGVRPATVAEVLRNLARKNLVRRRPYRGVELTPQGVAEARKLLRKHRILEVLFVGLLGLSPESACEEASKLDYYVSEELINAICRSSNHPKTCPCEKVIFEDPACCGAGGKKK